MDQFIFSSFSLLLIGGDKLGGIGEYGEGEEEGKAHLSEWLTSCDPNRKSFINLIMVIIATITFILR